MALPKVEYDWSTADEAESSECAVYSICAKIIQSPPSEDYLSFGITVTDAFGRCLGTVHDITCDKQRLDNLVNLCNHLSLSFCHLNDVIEDFLS